MSANLSIIITLTKRGYWAEDVPIHLAITSLVWASRYNRPPDSEDLQLDEWKRVSKDMSGVGSGLTAPDAILLLASEELTSELNEYRADIDEQRRILEKYVGRIITHSRAVALYREVRDDFQKPVLELEDNFLRDLIISLSPHLGMKDDAKSLVEFLLCRTTVSARKHGDKVALLWAALNMFYGEEPTQSTILTALEELGLGYPERDGHWATIIKQPLIDLSTPVDGKIIFWARSQYITPWAAIKADEYMESYLSYSDPRAEQHIEEVLKAAELTKNRLGFAVFPNKKD